jgi:hypothetical protein
MPFCPKCRAEYEFGIAKCSDCLIPLVNRLPEPQKAELESAVVHLCTVPNEFEAILICDILKQAGIEASYRSLKISRYVNITIDELFKNCWGGVIVLDKDYNTAKEIIDEYLKNIEEKQKPEENREED